MELRGDGPGRCRREKGGSALQVRQECWLDKGSRHSGGEQPKVAFAAKDGYSRGPCRWPVVTNNSPSSSTNVTSLPSSSSNRQALGRSKGRPPGRQHWPTRPARICLGRINVQSPWAWLGGNAVAICFSAWKLLHGQESGYRQNPSESCAFLCFPHRVARFKSADTRQCDKREIGDAKLSEAQRV